MVNDIEDILFFILFYEEWKSCYVYFLYERFFVELNENEKMEVSSKKLMVDLVVFDFCGILICL